MYSTSDVDLNRLKKKSNRSHCLQKVYALYTYSLDVTVHQACDDTEWRCDNGQCISGSDYQDMKPDCLDQSDESGEGKISDTHNTSTLHVKTQ